MRIAVIGSSPVCSIIALDLANKGNKVVIVSDQRHIGGAWRFTQEELTTKKIQVYNNILVALNEGECRNFNHALEMLNRFGVPYEPYKHKVIASQEYANNPKVSVNFNYLFEQVNQHERISMHQTKCDEIKSEKDGYLLDNRFYERVYLPESMPVSKLKLNGNSFEINHEITKSHHLHIVGIIKMRKIAMLHMLNILQMHLIDIHTTQLQMKMAIPIFLRGRVHELKFKKLKYNIPRQDSVKNGKSVYKAILLYPEGARVLILSKIKKELSRSKSYNLKILQTSSIVNSLINLRKFVD